MGNMFKKLGKAAIAVASLFAAQQAHAAGTQAGSTVTNTATVSYTIGGGGTQTATGTHDFTVDRKINVVVTEVGSTTKTVVPGSTGQYVTFQVSNESNDRIDIGLTQALNLTTGPRGTSTTPLSFDGQSPTIHEDTNNNGTYEAGTDLAITYLDNLLPTVDGNPTTGRKTVFVVMNIPSGLANGATEVISLTGEARISSGTDDAVLGGTFANDSAAADVAGGAAQNVFADGQGPAGDDGASGDSRHSAFSVLVVAASSIAATKTGSVISHPGPGGVGTVNAPEAKAIPGAIVEYCILLTHSGATAADGVVIDDPVPTTMTYVAGSLRSGETCLTATTPETDANNAGVGESDADGFGANFVVGPPARVTGSIATGFPVGGTRALKFRATIN
ncbi:hypothetical protein ACFOMD_15300 [Sphingoaurantiacus capsulatus]|uniref:DUF11 domain-containing protein n=1 Tax=Sphingoaurantiacus capsulatus TaxID=1771310 RepID=A0ABV7XGV2_9SPHN